MNYSLTIVVMIKSNDSYSVLEIPFSADDADEGSSKWLPVGEKSDSLTCLNTIINHPIVSTYLISLLKEK